MIDARTVRDTELDKVLSTIRKAALSPEGRDAITPDLVTSERTVIESRAERIEGYMNLLSGRAPDPFPPVSDILSFISSTHADLPGESIWRAGSFLHSYLTMLAFLERHEEGDEVRTLSEDILSAIDQEGTVHDDHPRIVPLIRERERIRAERERFSSRFIAENRTLVQQSEAMYRNERVVIPIRSDQRRMSGCYISGASSSGNTLFAEPQELLQLNNEAVIADERIRAEKLRIIHDLSDRVRSFSSRLEEMLGEVIDFDFHYAFACWAKKVRAIHPQCGDTLWGKLLEKSVQFVAVINLLLSPGVEDAVNVRFPLLSLGWGAAGPDAGEAVLVVPQQSRDRRKNILVQQFLPVSFLGEGE